MKKAIAILTAGLLPLCLSACGPLNEGNATAGLVSSVLGRGASQPQQAPASSVTREEIAASKGKYIRVNTRNTGRWDTNIQAGENGNRSTWIDSAQTSITFEDGVVVATRGLIRDLMAADVSQVTAALRAGGGNAQRRHEFLDNQDRISTELLQCRIVSAGFDRLERFGTTQETTKFNESCAGETLEFANVYWVNRNGQVVRSLQAISAQSGYLQIDIF